MITSLISFFSGSLFRMIWGEISGFITARQDHKHEIERMRLQAETEAAQHARNLEAIKLQADLGVQTIRVQGEADIGKLDAAAFSTAVELTGKSSGNWLVDAWNGVIRPGLATVSIGLVVCSEFALIKLSENGWALAGAALGIYVADRSLFKRGK
jgi:hypothetical protein